MSQGFRTAHNFCEQYCFQLPFSKAFVSLNPWSWARVREKAQLPALTQAGCQPRGSSVQTAVALQMVVVLLLGSMDMGSHCAK